MTVVPSFVLMGVSAPLSDFGTISFSISVDDVIYDRRNGMLCTVGQAQRASFLPRNSLCVSGCVFGVKGIRYSAGLTYGGTLLSALIPASVLVLSKRCFRQCERLSTVVFEGGSELSHIESWAFHDCSRLSLVHIPGSVEVLRDLCFSGCGNLAMVTFGIGSRLRHIDNSAFSSCSSLRSI